MLVYHDPAREILVAYFCPSFLLMGALNQVNLCKTWQPLKSPCSALTTNLWAMGWFHHILSTKAGIFRKQSLSIWTDAVAHRFSQRKEPIHCCIFNLGRRKGSFVLINWNEDRPQKDTKRIQPVILGGYHAFYKLSVSQNLIGSTWKTWIANLAPQGQDPMLLVVMLL